jgi:hypothetical protein
MSDQQIDLENQEVDANAWLALREQRGKAVHALSPSNKDEKEVRRPYISVFVGRPPPLGLTLQVAYAVRMADAMIQHKPLDDSDLDVADWMQDHAQSLRGKAGSRAIQLEEMGKMAPKASRRGGFISDIIHRE